MSQATLSKALKATYNGTVAFLGTLGTSLSGSETLSSLPAQTWTWIALTTLIAAGGTFGLAGWSGPRLNGTTPPKE